MRKLTWIRVFAAVTVPFLLACGGAAKKEPDAVLAVVDGDRITESMFRKEAEGLPPYIRPIVETPNGRAQFLDSLVTRELLLKEALRRGIDRTPEVRARFEQARRSILLEALLLQVAETAPGLSDNALKSYYEENKESLETGERVRVRHILFKEKRQAEETARLAKKGDPFEQLMKNAEAAGGKTADLGLIDRGDYDKEFEEAAFGAQENSIVGPVRTLYGFHVIQVLEKRQAGLPPFDEVREKIAAELRETAQREAFDNMVSGLKEKAKIQLMTVPEAGERPSAFPPPGKETSEAGAKPPQGGR